MFPSWRGRPACAHLKGGRPCQSWFFSQFKSLGTTGRGSRVQYGTGAHVQGCPARNRQVVIEPQASPTLPAVCPCPDARPGGRRGIWKRVGSLGGRGMPGCPGLRGRADGCHQGWAGAVMAGQHGSSGWLRHATTPLKVGTFSRLRICVFSPGADPEHAASRRQSRVSAVLGARTPRLN